jgi:hypothetical protein
MKRNLSPLFVSALLLLGVVAFVVAPSVAATTPTPIPNSVVVKTRVFNDCPSSTVATVNNYPAVVSIEDAGLDCFGWANRHNWRFSTDGVNPIRFDNNASFRFSATLKLEGDGNGEAGLNLSPWWSPDVDGMFNVRSTDGEIACFGGRLPFFTFTGAFGLHYAKGNPIELEVIYEPRGLSSTNPATIEYRLRYLGQSYTSGAIAFDQANPAEDPPHGLWGMLYEAQAGGYVQCFNTPGVPTTVKATFTDVAFSTTPKPTSVVAKTRIFNDCPSSNVTVSNDYPHMVTILDENLDCFGFANLHNWHFSENGVTDVPFNNDAVFRFSADLTIRGDGNGEAGLQISPWWSKDVDGRFNVRSTDGEIACFGGRLPFFTFTGAFGLRYTKGDKIHLEMVYDANGNSAADPATIEYRLSYLGTDYTSGPIAFDMANPGEDPPYGLYGMLNDGRAGGYAQFFNTPGVPTSVTAEFRQIEFSSCLEPANALLFMTPHKTNINSTLPYMTAYIWPEPPLLASQIDVASLRLNGVPALATPAPKVLNWNHTLRVTFPRAALLATLTVGKFRTLNLEGEIAGQCFDISDFIDVNQPKMHHPCKDDVVIAGTTTNVQWDVDPEALSIQLLQSLDEGTTWNVVASGVANTGSYRWRVPNQTAVGTRLALMNVYEQDGSGVYPDHEYGESEAFDIVSPTGVEGGELAFALRAKNPSSNGIQLQFSLPTSGPARLTVYDVAGREVLSSEVGGVAGARSLRVGGDLPAGMYVVRLAAAGRSVSSRAVVIR